MDPNAVLGPVDPQLQGIPAASILKVLEKKDIKDIEDHTLIMADVAQKAIDHMVNYTSGEKLFKQPRLPEKTIPNSITLKVGK